jgi:hypothetical protein
LWSKRSTLRRAAALPEADHALGLGGEVRQAGQGADGVRRGLEVAGEQGGEGDRADALDAGAEEAVASGARAIREGESFEVHGVQSRVTAASRL